MGSCYRVTGSPNIHEYPESADTALDFYANDLVQINTDGEVAVATAGVIYGIAKKNATGVQGTLIPVDILTQSCEFSAKYKAAATDDSLVTDILDFTFTAGAHTLDETGATTDVVCVDHGVDAWGVSGGRLICRLLASAVGFDSDTGT